MKPIRVLHLTPPGFGGIDSYIFSHYRHMDQNQFHFEFLTQNTALEKAEQYRDFSYKVWPMPTTAAQDRDGFVKNIQGIFQNGYDVLHLHTSYWTGFLLEELAKEVGIAKIIVHSHSTSVEENDPVKREALLKRHEEIKQVISPDLATDFCACSWKAADWLFGPQIPRDKIRIMKNAIEVERFQFNPEVRKRIRSELGLENAWVLGTVGRLSYPKNHEFLIEVFQELHKTHKNVKLIVVGDGELRDELEKQVQNSELECGVRLLGWKPDVENYLQAMDCFLLPSRFEGLGSAAVEALASGLPCIVSDQVPEDLAFTENIQYAPLQVPFWLSALERVAAKKIDRKNGTEIVKNAGFNVKYQVKELEKLYEA